MITRCNARERGMILVVVLWITAIMSLLVVALSAYAQKSLGLASVEASQLRSEMALDAGLEVAKALILASPPEQRRFFDGSEQTIGLGAGRLATVTIQDASGLIDLNRSDPELLKTFAARLEAGDPAQAMVLSVLDLRAKLAPREPGGKKVEPETDGAAADKPPFMPALFIAVQQLYGMGEADPASVDRIAPLITLYSTDGKINPLAAPEDVLRSIPGLTDDLLARIAAIRRQQVTDEQGLGQVIAAAPQFLGKAEPRIFRVDVRLTAGSGIITGSGLQATLLLDDAAVPPFQVLSWSW